MPERAERLPEEVGLAEAEATGVSELSWITPFTGLHPRQFAQLIAALRYVGADPVRKGRPWSLSLEDRVLLVAAYWRTDLTLRRLAPLFGISKSAADRIVDHLGPHLALQPRARLRKQTVLLMNGALTPGHERPGPTHTDRPHRTADPGHEVVIEADTRLVATGLCLSAATFSGPGRDPRRIRRS